MALWVPKRKEIVSKTVISGSKVDFNLINGWNLGTLAGLRATLYLHSEEGGGRCPGVKRGYKLTRSVLLRRYFCS